MGTSSTTCPQVCQGPTDGSCTGYPLVSRHTTPSAPTPPGSGSSILATCDAGTYVKAVLTGTPPLTSSPLCLGYWTQPIKTSFFVDTSKLGSFFDDVGPATFFPLLITFYSLSLPQVCSFPVCLTSVPYPFRCLHPPSLSLSSSLSNVLLCFP